MRTAVYAGSFDPFTLGHLDILEQGAILFDKIIILIGKHPVKQGMIPIETRIKLIQECTSHLPNIKVVSYEGLTVDFAKKNNAKFLLRGLRNTTDFEYEKTLGINNNQLASDIQTVYLISRPEYSHISSSTVRELVSYKKDISNLIPENIAKYLMQ